MLFNISHDDYQPSNIHLIAFIMKIFHISLHKYFLRCRWGFLLAWSFFVFIYKSEISALRNVFLLKIAIDGTLAAQNKFSFVELFYAF